MRHMGQQDGTARRRAADAPFAAALWGAALLVVLLASPNPLEASYGEALGLAMTAGVAACAVAGLALGCAPRVRDYVRASEPDRRARLPHAAIPLVGAATGALLGLSVAVTLLAGTALALWVSRLANW